MTAGFEANRRFYCQAGQRRRRVRVARSYMIMKPVRAVVYLAVALGFGVGKAMFGNSFGVAKFEPSIVTVICA